MENRKHLVFNEELGLGPMVLKVVECHLLNPNWTQEQIAKECGVSQPRVSSILRHKKVIAAFPILARRKMRSMVPKAVRKFEELMDQTENLEVSRKVTERVLTESKVLDAPEIHVKNSVEVKTTDELQQILKQATSLPTNVVDAELVDTPPEQ